MNGGRAPDNASKQPRNGRSMKGKQQGQDLSIAPGWYESGFGGLGSMPAERPRIMSHKGGNRDQAHQDKTPIAPAKPKVKRQPGSGPAGRGAFKAPVGSYKDDDDDAG